MALPEKDGNPGMVRAARKTHNGAVGSLRLSWGLLGIPQQGPGRGVRSSPRSRDSRGAQREEGVRQSEVSSLQVSPSPEDEVAWGL